MGAESVLLPLCSGDDLSRSCTLLPLVLLLAVVSHSRGRCTKKRINQRSPRLLGARVSRRRPPRSAAKTVHRHRGTTRYEGDIMRGRRRIYNVIMKALVGIRRVFTIQGGFYSTSTKVAVDGLNQSAVFRWTSLYTDDKRQINCQSRGGGQI